MFTYTLTQDPNIVLRSDGALIPNAPNGDWQVYQEWLANGNTPSSAPTVLSTPDWDGLINVILGGVLLPMYLRLTEAAFVNPATATLQDIANANNIAVALGKIDQAVQVTRIERAVASSFNLLLTTSNYTFTADEKTLWNTQVFQLNFSSTMLLN
jgi:hypothetical protein